MKKLFSFAFLVIFASSCASVEMTFNKNPAYHEKIKKIYFVFKDVKRTNFIRKLSEDLVISFNKMGIQEQHYVFDPLALETEKDAQKKIKTFAPEVVLTIERVSDNQGQNKYGVYYNGGYYVATLVPFGSETPVWKAAIDTHGETIDEDGNMNVSKDTVKKLVERLKLDGLL